MLDIYANPLTLAAMNSTLIDLTSQQLRRAAAIKERIQSLEKLLSQLIGGSSQHAPAPARRRKMRRAGKARIRAAALARRATAKGKKKDPAKRKKLSSSS